MSVRRAVAVVISVAIAYLAVVLALQAWQDSFLLYAVTLAHVVAAVGLALGDLGAGSDGPI
ncbi:MAG: hypothetical protein ABEJ05_08660 [Haloglomus sp.]